jgi:hypothetical protein
MSENSYVIDLINHGLVSKIDSYKEYIYDLLADSAINAKVFVASLKNIDNCYEYTLLKSLISKNRPLKKTFLTLKDKYNTFKACFLITNSKGDFIYYYKGYDFLCFYIIVNDE